MVESHKMTNFNRNHKAPNQDLLNLLDSESESDTIDLLDLPPLKGKKPKRKKKSSPDSGSCFSLCNIIQLVASIIMVVALGILAFVTYKLMHDVREMQEQLKGMENRQTSDHESFVKLQSMQLQIQSINATVYTVCSRKDDLKAVVRNLTAVSQQVESLKNTKQKTISKTDLEALRKNVVNIGSVVKANGAASEKNSKDIIGIQETIPLLQQSIARLSPGRENENNVSNPSLMAVNNVLTSLNQSIITHMKSYTDRLDAQALQLSMLKNDTIALKQNFTNLTMSLASPMVKSALQFNLTELTEQMEDNLDAYVRGLIQDALSNSSNSSSISATVDASEFSALQKQVQQLQTDHSQNIPASLSTITTTVQSIVDARLNTTEIKIQDLDMVVKSMNETVDNLTKMAIMAQNERTEMSHQISGTQRYVHRIGVSSSTTQQPDTEAPVE